MTNPVWLRTERGFGKALDLALETPCLAVAGSARSRPSRLLDVLASAAEPGRVLRRVPADARDLPRLRVEQLLRTAARRGARNLNSITEAFSLQALLDRDCRALDDFAAIRVALAAAVLAGAEGVALHPSEALSAVDRRAVLAMLRWLRDALHLRVVYRALAAEDLDDLADGLLVVDESPEHGVRVFGPDDPWALLGRTWRGAFAEDFPIRATCAASVDYLDEEGRWLRALVGGHEIYMPFVRLSPQWVGRIAVRPDGVLLRRDRLPEERLTNQVPGRIASIESMRARSFVRVRLDGCEAEIASFVEPDTMQLLGLEVGVPVVCVFEPSAVAWLE